jgi:tryptophan halogenase
LGRRKTAWTRNCIAIGGAASSLGPLLGTDLHLVQTGLARLIALFPHAERNTAAAAEYNSLTASEAERLRDFILLHYRTNGRRGDPGWDASREGPLPDALAYKVNLFESRARTPFMVEETFPESSWASVFLSNGVRSRRYDALADAVDVAELDGTLARMRSVMSQAVQSMPTHAEYIRAHCAAPPAEARS